MNFTKLRLAGFKSFVEPTELVIAAGLTGVVGPNGCGKSNLVEAFRWVMGESSAKRMRGGEMEDVIFAGTTLRPRRQAAEVSLSIDNSTHTAPAQFNKFSDIEITRRIERGAGSDYRVNGKSVRAKDVQLLFADAGSGAGSSALVSQGRVSALINAKPAERRLLLEEAAGISGLHARRHEAELRLKAAESNLLRSDDLMAQLTSRLKTIKSQVKQATRYRNIMAELRQLDALLRLHEWLEIGQRCAEAQAAFDNAETETRTAMAAASNAAAVQSRAFAALPPLRDKERQAAMNVQTHLRALERLETEKKHAEQRHDELTQKIRDLDADITHTDSQAEEALSTLEELNKEQQALLAEPDEKSRLKELDQALAALQDQSHQQQGFVDTISGKLSDLQAEIRQHSREREQADHRLRQAEIQKNQTETRAHTHEQQGKQTIAQRQELEQRLKSLNDQQLKQRVEFENTEIALQQSQDIVSQAEKSRSHAHEHLARIRAEADGLAAALTPASAASAASTKKASRDVHALTQLPSLENQIEVEPGYEAALAAALGAALDAPISPLSAADGYQGTLWQEWPDELDFMQSDPALPAQLDPLQQYVKAPKELTRRLRQIGIITDIKDISAKKLLPGQIAVTVKGDIVRWDGHTALGQTDPHAARLKQAGRLKDLRAAQNRAQKDLDTQDQALQTARTHAAQMREAFESARNSLRRTDSDISSLTQDLNRARQAEASFENKCEAFTQELDRIGALIEQETDARSAADAALSNLEDPAPLADKITAAREQVSETLQQMARIEAEKSGISAAEIQRQHRLNKLKGEIDTWSHRLEAARSRRVELHARRSKTQIELDALAKGPSDYDSKIAESLDLVGQAEAHHRSASDALAKAEWEQSQHDAALKQAEKALTEAKEARARCEADLALAHQARQSLCDHIKQTLGIRPEGLYAAASQAPDQPLPDIEDTRNRHSRLDRERDAMGPINLRAEIEAEETSSQIADLEKDREELLTAIEKLRQGIAKLNKEARERLSQAFETVGNHFQTLFTTLFGGGTAELRLTDTEDPLIAGLEIFASPPGKKTQHLSLLSGGEQALTALSLLFAMFLTNPAPLCVLDEVDAPLDDANVDRFCSLLEHMCRESQVRFLVITHHRMTMARMDHLYGVTMTEAGVSRLVSVDLGGAQSMPARREVA